MTQAERTFQERGKLLACRFEALATEIRREMARDDSAVDRTGCIFSAVQGTLGGMSLETLMKRAVLADEEPTQVADTWDLVGDFSEEWRPIFEQVIAESDHDIMAGVETKDAKFDLYCIKNYNTNEFFNRARELMADKERANES